MQFKLPKIQETWSVQNKKRFSYNESEKLQTTTS